MRRPQVGDKVRALVDWGFYDKDGVYDVCQVEYPDECGVHWFYIRTESGDSWPVPLNLVGKRVELLSEEEQLPIDKWTF